MAESALSAAYKAIRRRLTESSELWGVKVHPDLAPANVGRPYVVFFWSGGGELNARRIQDAELLLTVKCVANTLDEAFRGAGRVSALLNDADLADDLLEPGDEWVILHTNQERAIHLVENIDGIQIYHSGSVFRFRMERIT